MWCLDWQLQQEWEWVNHFQIQQRLKSSYSPAGRGSPKLNDDVKKPKGKAPMPKDMWKLSPKPNPGKPCAGSGSVRCPAGRGGTLLLRERDRERPFRLFKAERTTSASRPTVDPPGAHCCDHRVGLLYPYQRPPCKRGTACDWDVSIAIDANRASRIDGHTC